MTSREKTIRKLTLQYRFMQASALIIAMLTYFEWMGLWGWLMVPWLMIEARIAGMERSILRRLPSREENIAVRFGSILSDLGQTLDHDHPSRRTDVSDY